MGENTNKEEQSKGKKSVKNNLGEMSFLDHLEELRWHIIRSVLAICVLAVIAFTMKDFIFDTILLKPSTPDFWTNRMFAKLGDLLNSDIKINKEPLSLISIQLADQFMIHIWVSIIAGFILASPIVFFELWKFIKPALYEKEKRYAAGAVFYTSFLFILGVLFGYFLIVPLSIDFLNTYKVSKQVVNQFTLSNYNSMVTSIVLASGVTFLLPIFSYFLSKVGILTPVFMRTYRRHAYVVLLILAAIITPPDVISQIMVFIPLFFLYEISIFISKRVVKQREKDLSEM